MHILVLILKKKKSSDCIKRKTDHGLLKVEAFQWSQENKMNMTDKIILKQ